MSIKFPERAVSSLSPIISYVKISRDQQCANQRHLLTASLCSAHCPSRSSVLLVIKRFLQIYAVFICQQSYLLLSGIPSSTHSFIPGLKPNLLFLQILPTAALPFSSSGFTTWIPQTVNCCLWAYLFSTFSFSVFTLFSCRFRAVD